MLGKRNILNNDHLNKQSRRKYARIYYIIEDVADAINKDVLYGINNLVFILISYDLAVNDLIYEVLWKEVVNIELN